MADVKPMLDDCLDALIEAGPDREPGTIVWSELPALLASPEVARTLVARVAVLEGLSDDDDPAARRLLEALLDAARRADEEGKTEGTVFLEEAARVCGVCVEGDATSDGLLALSVSYRRAGLETPEVVRQAQMRGHSEADGDAMPDRDSAVADLAEALREMVDAADDNLLAVYNQMGESMAGMPDAACQALIHEMGGWDDHRFARLCAYWVLDPRAALAQSAADVLAERARADRLDGDTAGRLAWLRPLLPEGAVARSVEAALEAYRQRQRRWPAVATAAGRTNAYASLVDGAGAQYLALADADGSRCALVLVKAGYGIRDGYVLDQLDDDDVRELWETLQAAFDIYPVALATAATLIAAAVAEGQARGETPPPGLIDVAIAAGLHELRPLAVTGRAWLAYIGAAEGLDALTPQKRGRLINRSARWADELKAPATWFEDNDDVRQVVLRAGGEDEGRRRLRRYLDGRRDRWAERLLRSALVVDSDGQAELAASMAATAQALLDGREIRRIPVMEHIVEATLEAWMGDAAAAEEPAPPAGEAAHVPDEASLADFPPLVAYPEDKRSVLQRLFDRGQGARVWPAGYYGVHGYLFAIATHPEPIPPSALLEPLLGDPDGDGVAFRRKRDAESVIEAVGAIHDAIVDHLERDEPALPAGVKTSVDANASTEPGAAVELAPDAPICQWAHGFCIAIDTFGHLDGPLRAELGDNSELAAEVDVSHMMLRVLADPQGFAEMMVGQQNNMVSPGQVVAAALDGLDRYLGVLVQVANAYQDTDAEAGPERGPSRGSGGLTTGAGEGADTGPPQPARSQKVGRNEPCPCGSGRKYKRCCGNTASA